MSKVNFVSEFNSFMRYARDNNLSMRERILWIALFYTANDRAAYNEQTQEYEWPDGFIQVSNGELNLYCCLDKRGIETMRNLLKQRGLIDFQPGMKNKKNPSYRMFYLTAVDKSVENPVDNQAGSGVANNASSPCGNVGNNFVPNNPPNYVPSHAPNNVPNNAPNRVPSHVPSHMPNNEILGTNLHPTMSPYPKDKYINDSQIGYGAGVNVGLGQRTYRSERNGGYTPQRPKIDNMGFVDLDGEGGECEGFVPLPWEADGT